MAITKQKKESLISELDGLLKNAVSLVFVKFNRLNVADTTNLRRTLRNNGVGYKVAKKTLMKRVLGTKSISGDMPELPGEIAIAYGDDATAPAREVYTFLKDHKENIEIVGGMFEGKYMSGVQMLEIATIPSREVLLSKIAFLLKSPMQRLAIAVNEVAKSKA